MTSTTDSHRPTRAESLALLGSVPVACVAFQVDELPTVLMANFCLTTGGALVTARSEPLLEAARRRLYVVLVGDDYDLDSCSGWAVSAVGRAELLGDPMRREARSSARAGTAGAPVVRVAFDLVAGRRVGRERPAAAAIRYAAACAAGRPAHAAGRS